MRVEGLIQHQINKFLDVLERAAEHGKVMDLTLGFRCLTADVIMDYCYQETFGALDAPDFQSSLIVRWQKFLPSVLLSAYFPRTFQALYSILSKLPDALLKRLVPAVASSKLIQDAS